jgi:hypothetical protein
MYCAWTVEPCMALDFIITSLTPKTCLPDCIPHFSHESCMKRAPRDHKDQCLPDATYSEVGILPPVQSHWRHEQRCFGIVLPNPSLRREDSYPGARDFCIQQARRSRIIRVHEDTALRTYVCPRSLRWIAQCGSRSFYGSG